MDPEQNVEGSCSRIVIASGVLRSQALTLRGQPLSQLQSPNGPHSRTPPLDSMPPPRKSKDQRLPEGIGVPPHPYGSVSLLTLLITKHETRLSSRRARTCAQHQAVGRQRRPGQASLGTSHQRVRPALLTPLHFPPRRPGLPVAVKGKQPFLDVTCSSVLSLAAAERALTPAVPRKSLDCLTASRCPRHNPAGQSV